MAVRALAESCVPTNRSQTSGLTCLGLAERVSAAFGTIHAPMKFGATVVSRSTVCGGGLHHLYAVYSTLRDFDQIVTGERVYYT